MAPAREAHVNAVLLRGVQELHDCAEAPLSLWHCRIHHPGNCLRNFGFFPWGDGHAFTPHQETNQVLQERDVVGRRFELEGVEAGRNAVLEGVVAATHGPDCNGRAKVLVKHH